MNLYNFSFIIPHKNIPNLLRKCLDSIPHRGDVQIIVIDDNSDASKVDFAHFPGVGEKNTEVYFTKKGKGAGYARNEGLKHVKGKWIFFADADDYYSEAIESFLDKFKETDYDCVFYQVSSLDIVTKEPTNRCDFVNQAIIAGAKGDEWHLKTRTYYSVCKMISSSYLFSLKLKYEELFISEDLMFSLKLACNMRSYFVYLDYPVYVVTTRQNSLSTVVNIPNIYTQAYVENEFNSYLNKLGHPEWKRAGGWLELLFQKHKGYFLLASLHKSYCDRSLKPIVDALRVCIGYCVRLLKK